ncbi:hypothetical protein EMIHUDRAFT_207210 [Emiliania huxleyi CCMP1516]|uniref:Isopenicillin N synthase-like Fe(2+) 2OG dioxygenase domain-containing protein n=2 Tax=Emiliania huxleyi TaxID=2903 RepID=A0A0D3JKR7_EMIH1|nr:hypothetical protein EMIHUDRAFT_207210 [Emiliania huxleyi CCMP1516]EOD24102.1 hypothetical protein EMIHUDRAFT_207210 [Emiliania huxleyi CCMP1516]|eukprot:XP_005776531.1 hypothetical protein EMIHUDRAFT_207210 [Emiliania huxleyi CCMP1516]
MALAVYYPPPLDVGPPPPPSRRLTSARRRLARLRSSPAREALEVARQLEANGFAVLDGFLGAAAMGAVRDELEGRGLCDSGGAASGQVRSGRVSALRSDVSRWQRVDGSGGRVGLLRPLDLLANRTDGLVAALRDHAGSAPLADNVCSGGAGARCNGRRATAVYYLNPPAEAQLRFSLGHCADFLDFLAIFTCFHVGIRLPCGHAITPCDSLSALLTVP